MSTVTDTDRELVRLHRRACTDFAARMRLPAWEHLAMPLAAPLEKYTVADLLRRAADGNLAAAASLVGQPTPPPCELDTSLGGEPTQVVTESIRTVLTVASGLTTRQPVGVGAATSRGNGQADAGASASGLAPGARELLWQRTAELTVLGYDLQQAIRAGAGLDDLLVDRLLGVAPEVSVWPNAEPLDAPLGTPPEQRFLRLCGRLPGAWVGGGEANCETGNC